MGSKKGNWIEFYTDIKEPISDFAYEPLTLVAETRDAKNLRTYIMIKNKKS